MDISQTRSRIRHRAIAAACALAVTVGACSASGGHRAGGDNAGPAKSAPSSERSSPSSNTSPGSTAPTETKTFKLASATYPMVKADVPSDPIASAPAEKKGIFLDIYALQRTGSKSVALVFGLRNDSSDSSDVYEVNTDLGGGATESKEKDYTVSGVSLFDPSGLKRYLVYLDSKNACLCSDTDIIAIQRGQSRIYAAQLPAPPTNVTKVAVQTPVGAVADVEISNG